MKAPVMTCFTITACMLLVAGVAAAASVVPNPDFDVGSQGWSGGTLVLADGAPSAPSYLVESPANNEFAAWSDCFPLDSSVRYTFDARMRITSGSVGIAHLRVYSDEACAMDAGGPTPYVVIHFGAGNWVALSHGTQSTLLPSSAIRGRVRLVANSGVAQPGRVQFDHIVLQLDDVFTGDFDAPPVTR